MTSFLRHRLWPAAALLLVLTLVTGVVYPVLVTVIAQVVFPAQANGSYVMTGDGRAIGSSLIGQAFSQAGYLRGRPSAAGATDENPLGYDGMSSAGSNLGPTSQDLLDRIAASVDALRAEHGDAPIPVELVTTSASGLDPHISPEAADYQVARVAEARGISEEAVREAVQRHTEQPTLGFLGKPRVNVLLVNLDMDGLLQ